MSALASANGPAAAYALLKDRFGQFNRLEGVRRLLFWDSQTYMPPGGAAGRDAQNSLLEGFAHDLIAGSEIADALAAAADGDMIRCSKSHARLTLVAVRAVSIWS